jgi:hypothetical protein
VRTTPRFRTRFDFNDQRDALEFSDLTQKDMDDASDDPDEIVDRVQKKTGQPRKQVEQRVQR